MKFNKRKSFFESDGVAIMIQGKYISNYTIFEWVLYFLVIKIFLLIENRRELNKIVGVYFDTPVSIAFHFY
jgi:hypothetical protein